MPNLVKFHYTYQVPCTFLQSILTDEQIELQIIFWGFIFLLHVKIAMNESLIKMCNLDKFLVSPSLA